MLLVRKDVGAHLATAGEGALDPAAITAGAGNDGVAVAGPKIDRFTLGRSLFMSAKLVINYVAAIANTKTLSLTVLMEHCATVSGTYATLAATRARFVNNLTEASATAAWTAITLVSGAVPATVVATSTGSAQRHAGCLEVDFDLAQANQFLRATVTADLNASGTDTVVLSGILVMGGAYEEQAL